MSKTYRAAVGCPECGQLADRPEHDATDVAHPAWWRGYSHGAAVATQLLAERLGLKYEASMTWPAVLAQVGDQRA